MGAVSKSTVSLLKCIKEYHFITNSLKMIVVKVLHHLIQFMKVEDLDSFIDFVAAFNLVYNFLQGFGLNGILKCLFSSSHWSSRPLSCLGLCPLPVFSRMWKISLSTFYMRQII